MLCIVGAVLIPFYIAYGSGNFWLKKSVLFEQPQVKFTYEILTVFQGVSSNDPDSIQTWVWDTVPEIQQVYEPFLRPCIVRAWPTDSNLDGISDEWTITVQMPLDHGDKVYQVQSVARFTYELVGRAALFMDTIAYIEHSSPIPGRGLNVEADAQLRQKEALSVRKENILSQGRRSTPASLQENLISTLVSSYSKRNFTMELSNTYKVWSTIGNMDQFSTIPDSFLLNFTLRIPTDQIVYIPDVPQVLKVAWIQYFSIAAIFFILFYILEKFVYTNQVLETMVFAEGQKSNTRKGHTF